MASTIKISLFALITITLVACGVQDDRSSKGNDNLPPSCGTDCNPAPDAGQPSGDAGTEPTNDAGNVPTPDAGSEPTPDAGSEPEPAAECNEDGDCADDEECHGGFCVPAGIVPDPVPAPECDSDEDCGSGCECSNGKCIPVGSDEDTAPPSFSDIQVAHGRTDLVTQATVTVSWKTDEAANECFVAFLLVVGDQQLQLGYAVNKDEFATSHSVTLRNLTPGTDYSFHVGCTDQAGNAGTSDNDAFRTAYLDGPFRSAGGNVLLANHMYLSQTECARMKGNFPGTNWDGESTAGAMSDTDGDGWLEFDGSAASAGIEYRFNYVDIACGSTLPSDRYATWDFVGFMRSMSLEDLAFIECNWFDNATGEKVLPPDWSSPNNPGTPDGEVTDADYECHGSAKRNADGSFTGTGLQAYPQP